jgi:tRNA threonylcarbamoyladenosine biosynthesis protein TsaB
MAVRLLAFDTATDTTAVALRCGRGDFVALQPGGALASTTLLPCIRALLGQAGLALSDLDAIAFGRGPGAFTGLRTSCSVAQGLGFGLGRPLLPVDSLLIVAEDARAQAAQEGADFDVGVAMDARMDEVYAGRFRWAAGRWQTLDPAALYTLPALATHWAEPPRWLAGSAISAFGERLRLPEALPRLPAQRQRAAALLRLAQQSHDDGDAVDPADALPLYLRDKVALTTREREAVRGGGR